MPVQLLMNRYTHNKTNKSMRGAEFHIYVVEVDVKVAAGLQPLQISTRTAQLSRI